MTTVLAPTTQALYNWVRRSCYSSQYLVLQRETIIVALLEGRTGDDLRSAWGDYTRGAQADEAELPPCHRWHYHAAAELDLALISFETAQRSDREIFLHDYYQRIDDLVESVKERESTRDPLSRLIQAEMNRLSFDEG